MTVKIGCTSNGRNTRRYGNRNNKSLQDRNDLDSSLYGTSTFQRLDEVEGVEGGKLTKL